MDYFYLIHQRFCQLETQLSKLSTELEQLKAKTPDKPINIEHLEYKINELHIKNLSGTLNLGLTAQAGEGELQELTNGLVKENRCNISLGSEVESSSASHVTETEET